jgi:hypothetical protein
MHGLLRVNVSVLMVWHITFLGYLGTVDGQIKLGQK